jgi:uncharacterized membrane protein
MSTVQKYCEVDVPVRVAYDQWTQFESFPQFMEGVDTVQQLGDTMTHWRTSIGGVSREFDAQIIEQVPDQRIVWRSTGGEVDQAGTVTFEPLGAGRTRVGLMMDFEPQGMTEKIGDSLGIIERRVDGDLQRFKEYIESRGMESGGGRGEVHGGQSETPGMRSRRSGLEDTGL